MKAIDLVDNEIGELYGLSGNAVYNRIRRAQGRLSKVG